MKNRLTVTVHPVCASFPGRPGSIGRWPHFFLLSALLMLLAAESDGAPGQGVPAFQSGLRPAGAADERKSAPDVLDDPQIPIVGWLGPAGAGGAGEDTKGWLGTTGATISDRVMRDMAAAGFNVSLSPMTPPDLVPSLDIAARNHMRLIVMLDELRVGADFVLDEAKKQAIRELVLRVREHPGLYGYFLSDEPLVERFEMLAETAAFIRSIDPRHICYINLETPIPQDGFGAGSVELKWGRYIERVRPQVLSSHQYPVRLGWPEEIARLGNGANVFGRVIVKPEMFEVLEHYRTFSLVHGIPFWAFTNSVHHGPYPEPTEGHMRFQLMCNLAYGARGLQYFSYAYASALVRRDGSPTPVLELAARINRDVHGLWATLRELQSVGVYHTGPAWTGTRALPVSTQPMTVNVKGDPAVIGLFMDRDGMKYVLLVNRNPVDWGRFEIEAHLKEGADQYLTYLEPDEGIFFRRWPYRSGFRSVTLPPGGAILFRLGGDGPKRF